MYHKVTIAGNLGRDPEMRYLPDGTAVTNFSVAVSDGWGENKKTIWFRVTAWRKTAELANQYLSKGRKILIEGRLTVDPNTGGPRIWTRQDGTVASSLEMTADNLVFIDSRSDSGGSYDDGESSSSGGSTYGGGTPVEEDDIPF
jgi:single-strand DNA-binding protein